VAEKDDLKNKAAKLQQAYLANLSLKLREGKSLSEREFEHLVSSHRKKRIRGFQFFCRQFIVLSGTRHERQYQNRLPLHF
jgi:hypothetical protein